jgi:uncharacterized protein YbjT (DUF2867 family)
MADKKIIAIVGATGAQGGGLARAILDDPEGGFAVRALTRDLNSPAAQDLAARGAELAAVDVDDAESLKSAFAGAYGAFCVTFFWAHFSPDKEKAHAAAMAEAAKAAGLKHVIWSTLEDTRKWIPLDDSRMPTLMEHYKVPHFDAKGEADAIFAAAGVPTTNLLTSFYWDNLIHFGMAPQQGEDDQWYFTLPMGTKKLPGIAAEDIGRCAYGILRRGPELAGKTVGVAGEHLTGAEMAGALGKALGFEVHYNAMDFDAYRGLGFPGADDLGNMFQFKHDFEDEFCSARDLAFSRELNPGLQSFAEWLERNKASMPLKKMGAAT